MRLQDIIAAEFDKLRTLPVAPRTMVSTILAGALATVAVVSSDARLGRLTDLDVVLEVVPIVQVGFVLLGALPAAQEHAGRQVRTTLAAVPHRSSLVVCKTLAATSTLALTASATVAASLAAGAVTYLVLGEPQPSAGTDLLPLLGAAGHLTLIGLFTHAVALLARHLLPTLAIVLSIVLIISPVLGGLTPHARWLPDRAAIQLYDATDRVLTAATGSLVACAWIFLIGTVGLARFSRRDA